MVNNVLPQASRALLAVLLVIKLGLSVWNAAIYPSLAGYDYNHHIWRVKTAGLGMGKLAYNPPLYYLPVLPRTGPDAPVEPLMVQLRAMNVGYLALFYVVWVFFLFPRILPDRRAALLAGVFLLSLPGYQKAAVMVHPDNLLVVLSTCSFALWVWLEDRQRPIGWLSSLGLGILSGLTGMTRPFAIVPVLITWALNLRASYRSTGQRFFSAKFLVRALAVSVLVASLSASWYVIRYVNTGHVMNAYVDNYVQPYQAFKADFSFRHYYTTFYYRRLLEKPNRTLTGKEEPSHNPMANSFFTIFYSEVWGDHWLYFSGRGAYEGKLWVKRTLLVVALPSTILIACGFLVGIVRTILAAVREREWVSKRMVMLAMAVGGVGIYLYWQSHAGLLPGKNSSIKFLYVAFAIPYAVLIAHWFTPRRTVFCGLLALGLTVYAFALPVAMYVPAESKTVPHHDTDASIRRRSSEPFREANHDTSRLPTAAAHQLPVDSTEFP